MDPEKLGSDPFIRQVMADVERATGTDALETYTTKGGHTYRPGDALDSHTDENDSVIRLVIDHVDEEHVWYTTLTCRSAAWPRCSGPCLRRIWTMVYFSLRPRRRSSKCQNWGRPQPSGRFTSIICHCAGKGASDQAYRNAVQNSDRENAMLEGEEAIKRAVLSIEDPIYAPLL